MLLVSAPSLEITIEFLFLFTKLQVCFQHVTLKPVVVFLWGGGGTRFLIQGFTLAKQVLYHASYYTSFPFCCGYFGDHS
jgi:hypothetical protein